MHIVTSASRRRFIAQLAASGAFFTTCGVFAEALTLTPRQTEGPFYPDHLPLDTDNDLLILNESITPAVGEITYLSGRILGPDGTAIRGATIEIWQCDAGGAYLHSRTGNVGKRDKNFQGYGRFLTAGSGEYLFRTIKPVPYPGRTPHIHAKVRINGRELLTTQVYIKGHDGNAKDGIYKNIRDEKARESVTVDFAALSGAPSGVLAAKWDIILGTTPHDDEHSKHEHTPPERTRRTGGPGPDGAPGGRPPRR